MSSRSLVFGGDRSSNAFRLAGIIALPVAVDTAVYTAARDDELRLWINRPATKTLQLRVRPDRSIEELPPLGTVASGAARCDGEFVVTGANAEGRPVVLGLADDGTVAWQFSLDGPVPIRWPIPLCAPRPTIVWQTSTSTLEVARVDRSILAGHRAVPVGGPPLVVASAGDSIWAAWTGTSAVTCAEITETGVRAMQVPADLASDAAICGCSAGACVAWIQNGSAYFTRIVHGAAPTEPVVALDLAEAAGGTMALVAGPRAVVWAQRGEIIEGETPRWTSALVLPGWETFTVEGRVQAVVWWAGGLVVVGSEALYFVEVLQVEPPPVRSWERA